ncbi:MAG: hypothetical protein JWR00_2244 [Rubritepida sp.]|nr:hypothetical protein [Rubritepida sp.]
MPSPEIRALLDSAQIRIEWRAGDELLVAMRQNLAQPREVSLTANR